MNETLSADGPRSVLRMQRRLAHPPQRVWRALTEPGELAGWFPFDVAVELRRGAVITFRDRDGGPGTTGEVTECDPPRVFAYSWGTDHLRWEVEPADGGSLLTLTHAFDDQAGAASFAAGWTVCVAALEQVLAGEPVMAPDPGGMVAAHERFVARFGLGASAVSATAEGWLVRVERQLTVPAAVAWAALGGPAAVPGSPAPAACAAEPAMEVVEVREAAVLECVVADGRVRLELGPGTGQGARLHVRRTGRDGDGRAAAAAWEGWVAALSADLATTGRALRP